MPSSAIQHREHIGRYHSQTHDYVSNKKIQQKLNGMAASPGDGVVGARAHLMLQALTLATNISVSLAPAAVRPSGRAVSPLLSRQAAPTGPAAPPPANSIHEMKGKAPQRLLFNMLSAGQGYAEHGIGQDAIAFMYISPEKDKSFRQKRISLDISAGLQEQDYRDYIEKNCHIRTKTNQGKVLGDSLLVTGEYIRNPVRGFAEKLKEWIWGNGELSEIGAILFEVVNLGHDIIFGIYTIGAYPIIKYTSAKALSVSGHSINGDSNCVRNEFSAEEMANLLFNTEVGITDRRGFSNPLLHHKPRELQKANAFDPDGVFVHEKYPTGINTVKHLAVDLDGAIQRVRQTEAGEYIIPPGQQGNNAKTGRKVFYDAINDKIHIDGDVPEGQGVDYTVQNGKKFIKLYGENYELKYSAGKRTHEVKLRNHDGTESRIPVYHEKISHSWHLGTHNNKPAFTFRQEKRIKSFKVRFDGAYEYIQVDNLNPKHYGAGKIIEVRSKDTMAMGDNVIMRVVELKGELVPVRAAVVPKRGLKYEIFNRAMPGRRGHPVEFDGRRWLFEAPTSIHVAKTLRRAIAKDIVGESVNAFDLSTPDKLGLRWDINNNSYLKIKNKYFKVKRYPQTAYKFFLMNNHRKINLRFKKNKFHVENFRERINDLRKIGMSGRAGLRPRKHAVDILKDLDGFDLEQAKTLLSQYHFPQEGLFNEYSFALHIEQFSEIPPWAKRFKIDESAVNVAPAQGRKVPVFDPDDESVNLELLLGTQIGEGDYGIVFQDGQDPNWYIKMMRPHPDGDADIDIEMLAEKEAESFRLYYGPESAKVFADNDGNFYNRMYKIPGITLDSLPEGSLPHDAVERFVDMLEKLNNVNMIHADLHGANMLWDAESEMFFPIDIIDIKKDFFRSGNDYKHSLNMRGEERWDDVIYEIKQKMAP
ncbi:hypothetical protein [Sodalis sp. RH19]|uniref:OspG family effector kinase n=1 Tax=Sodalis sp. RH19 TaxID=3394334 RepID=UPI0039B40C51